MTGALTTEALLLDRDLAMTVGERTLPVPGPDDALLEVEWSGLCGSDLHVARTGDWVTDWPATLGHEIYGRVLQAPPGGRIVPGGPVVADSRLPCGACLPCRAGTPDDCAAIRFVGEAVPGGFARLCVLPVALLHEVPERLEGSTAVLAEPLAVALHALSHLSREPGRVALLGHGPIGALVHIELRRAFPGTEVTVAEPAPLRASLAAALGANCVSSGGELAAAEHDLVIDAAGYPGSLIHAIAGCAAGAELLVVGLSEVEVAIRPMELAERRLRLVGCNAFRSELPRAVQLLAEEPWRYAPVVTDVVELSELPAAIGRQLREPNAVKVLVRV